MKINITAKQRICGILLGVSIVLLLLVTAVAGIFKNKYFYITQNNRYGIIETTNLKNNDEYALVYGELISAFSNKENVNATVTLEDGQTENICSADEYAKIQKIATAFTAVCIISCALACLSIGLAVYTFIKENRIALKGIGIYVIIFGIAGLVIVNVLTFALNPNGLAEYFVTENQGAFIKNIFTANYFSDFLKGARRFYDFVTLIPIGLGCFLIRFSKKKNYTPDGEYMYQ